MNRSYPRWWINSFINAARFVNRSIASLDSSDGFLSDCFQIVIIWRLLCCIAMREHEQLWVAMKTDVCLDALWLNYARQIFWQLFWFTFTINAGAGVIVIACVRTRTSLIPCTFAWQIDKKNKIKKNYHNLMRFLRKKIEIHTCSNCDSNQCHDTVQMVVSFCATCGLFQTCICSRPDWWRGKQSNRNYAQYP